MSTPEATQKALEQVKKPTDLKGMIEASAKELQRALPEHMKPERLVRIALTCIRQTPDLAKCTPESFLGALFTAAQLGIEPVAGRAFLIPFNNSKKDANGEWHTVKEAQFVLGYKGVADLFYRHEKAVNLEWGIVKEKDFFEYERGTSSFLRHKEAVGDRGATTGYWVLANLVNGGKPFHYMTAADTLDHGKKHSKAWVTKEYDKAARRKIPCEPHWQAGSPWADDTDAMCLKTVLVQLAKILPLSIELQKAIQADETSRDFRRGVDDVLDLPVTTNWDQSAETKAEELEHKQDSSTEEKNKTENA